MHRVDLSHNIRIVKLPIEKNRWASLGAVHASEIWIVGKNGLFIILS